MSKILRRPMFRGGGKVSSYGNGIASGMGYAGGGRVGYQTGGNILSNILKGFDSNKIAINPATNLKVYGSVIFRKFNPEVNTDVIFENQTTWVNLGVRTDLFNWHFDF